MIKYTKHTLKKVEGLFDKIKYTIRYERGNFQSGYCIVENKRIAVINKFYDAEARINCLIEILGKETVDPEMLDEKENKLYLHLTEAFNAKSAQAEEEEGTDQEKETPEDTTGESSEETVVSVTPEK